MLNKLIIALDEFSKIKDFAQRVVNYEADIVITKNGQFYNAKSILSVMVLLDMAKPVEIQIISDDMAEVRRFMTDMSDFKA